MRKILLAVALLVLLSPFMAAAQRPPNIVLILADDLGWTDLGVYGSSFYETPNLDRLAAQGMRFTDAYAAAPVCSPTRASILTGRYPARIGLTDYLYGKAAGKLEPPEYVDHLPPDLLNLAQALRHSGYTTWHVGKWHLGRRPFFPEQQGFDVNIAGHHRGTPPSGYFAPWKIENLAEGENGEYLTDRLTDEAIRLIRENRDRPFFLNYWSYAPHTPIQAPPDLVKKYQQKAAALGLDQRVATEEGEFFPTTNKKDRRLVRRHLQSHAVYAAMIENLDTNVGRLLDALDEAGQSDNTLVIFSSDNGGLSTAEGAPTSNAPLRDGKGWLYEGGIRVPLIVRWPGVAKAGAVSHVPVTSPDFLPTLLGAAGAAKTGAASDVDGISLMPLLRGQRETLGREAIYWHYPHYGNQGGAPAAAIRRGDWKLIWFFEDDRLELYNLADDPSERNNLRSSNEQLASELFHMLQEWQRAVNARFPRVAQATTPE